MRRAKPVIGAVQLATRTRRAGAEGRLRPRAATLDHDDVAPGAVVLSEAFAGAHDTESGPGREGSG